MIFIEDLSHEIAKGTETGLGSLKELWLMVVNALIFLQNHNFVGEVSLLESFIDSSEVGVW